MTTPDVEKIRRENLLALAEQYGGFTGLARHLKFSGPSYISQLYRGHRPFTEKGARSIERTLRLPDGFLDRSEKKITDLRPVDVQTSVLADAVRGLQDAAARSGLRISPGRLADATALVYHLATRHGVPAGDADLLAFIVRIASDAVP